MKLGDSLGRNRRRRKKKQNVSDDLGSQESAEKSEGIGFAAPMSENTSAVTAEKSSMNTDNASSVPRRVGKVGLAGSKLVGAVVGIAVIGGGFGYLVSTQVLFPAPPPPRDLFEVPDLRGMGLATAGERLAGANLEMGIVDSLRHPSVAAGLILGQSPLPTQVATPETLVRITISMGPQMRSVPDVLRLDESRARVVLETSGFVVSVDTAEADAPRGRVIEVSPSPDSIVALPGQVRLVVSTGPPVVPMPLVLGLEQLEAEALLDSLGLVVTDVQEVFRFGRDQGIIVEQEPLADTELQRGSGVRLKVGIRGLGTEL
jgi:beta-lactam-binding protein with PASTA domain